MSNDAQATTLATTTNVKNTTPMEVDMPTNEAAPEEDNNVVPPVPILSTTLGTAPQALIMMAATASVVDVPLIEPPLVRAEEEIHEVPVVQIIVTSPNPTDREVAETSGQLASPKKTELTTNTRLTRRRRKRTPSPRSKRSTRQRHEQSERSP
jgi:hypothetical protein